MKLFQPNQSSLEEGITKRGAKTTWANITAILIAGMGSFVFGYANNSIAGSLAQKSFIAKFLMGDNANSIIGGIMGAFLGGGLLGAIFQGPISNRYGRRIATGVAALLMVLSGAIQAGAVHIAMFIVGRFICGVSAGMVITNCPVHMSEIAPPHIRGMLVSNHAISIIYAYILSSIMALAFNYVTEPYQWRLQFVLLTFFALVLFLSIFILPESPRWLCEQGRYDDAWKILERLHKSDGVDSDSDESTQFARAEMVQIKAQIEVERTLPRGYLHIIRTPHLRHRAICSALVWIMGQSTGILVIANLTPTLFARLGFDTAMQLGLSVAWTACALLGALVNALLMDRIGRVKLLVSGGYISSLMLLGEALLQKYYLGSNEKGGLNAGVAFFFLFIFFYGSTIDCAAYVYIAEIWPTHLRSYGNTIGLVAFFSCALAYTVPASQAFTQIGWKYYLVMICVCVVSATAMWFVCPETKQLTLEEINAIFSDEVAPEVQPGGAKAEADGKERTLEHQEEC